MQGEYTLTIRYEAGTVSVQGEYTLTIRYEAGTYVIAHTGRVEGYHGQTGQMCQEFKKLR